jgi:hypothetical protein
LTEVGAWGDPGDFTYAVTVSESSSDLQSTVHDESSPSSSAASQSLSSRGTSSHHSVALQTLFDNLQCKCDMLKKQCDALQRSNYAVRVEYRVVMRMVRKLSKVTFDSAVTTFLNCDQICALSKNNHSWI